MKRYLLAVPSPSRPLVTVLYKSLPHYRIPFFEALRLELERRDVTLRLIYGQPNAEEAKRRHTGEISWGHAIENRLIPFGSRNLWWQPCGALLRGSDLVIVEQASKLLLNYVLLAQQSLGGPKVAFWGHGRNFLEQRASRAGEAVKRLVSRWPHWWFAYTEASAEVIRRLAYPPERITVVQNAIDTSSLRARLAVIDSAELTELRRQWDIQGRNIGISVGGLYAEKRVAFLLDAARALRKLVPDVELIVIGAGPDQVMVERACRQHPWIHYPGPHFGTGAVPYFALSRVMLLPGVVGLAVLDAFAMEVPPVTVDLTGHGPEIDYVRHAENGLKLPVGTAPEEYAAAVACLLSDDAQLKRLKEGCRAAAQIYTLEAMVGRFADGVQKAIRFSSGWRLRAVSRCED